MQRLLSAAVLALFAASAVAAVGCGTTTGQGNQRAANAPVGTGDGSDVECHDEQVLGSTIPRRVCRDKAQSDLDRKGAQDWQSRPAASPTSAR